MLGGQRAEWQGSVGGGEEGGVQRVWLVADRRSSVTHRGVDEEGGVFGYGGRGRLGVGRVDRVRVKGRARGTVVHAKYKNKR